MHSSADDRERRHRRRRARAGGSRRCSTCGIGAIKSIWSIGTSASTELVPRMNITAMIGAATTTDRAIAPHRVAALAGVNRDVLEAAERAEPHLAEQVEAHDRHHRHRRRQRMKRGDRPVRARSATAATISAPKVATISTPPALWTHLPTLEARAPSTTTRAPRITRADEPDEPLVGRRAARPHGRGRRRSTA